MEKLLKPIIRTNYANAVVFKYDNTRVRVVSHEKEVYIIEFKKLTDDPSPRSLHCVEKGKIVITGMKLTTEDALSLMVGLQERLRQDGIIF